MYSLITLFTAFIAGQLFNLNHYLPMYLSIIIYVILFAVSCLYYEAQTPTTQIPDQTAQPHTKKPKLTWLIFLVLLSNTVFYSIIKMGQNNSKLFMQYDFQAFLSVEMLTYYITTIVVISRIVRVLGNIIFGKLYTKIKDKMSIVLTVCLSMAFALLITGHFVNVPFIYKVIIMSLGFFLILGTRDSFQVYIEDVALNITNKEEYQRIIINIEMTRRLGTLILSAAFTLILINYELIVIEFILLSLSIVEIFINCHLCRKLKKIRESRF